MTNSKIILSIIIPIYNVEKYVSECIESITSQLDNNIEIIVINDGSTDNSATICSKYAQYHTQFTLINQNNKGVSAARNLGLRLARGEYIFFVDGDDVLAPDAIKNITNKIINQKVDIVVGSFVKFFTKIPEPQSISMSDSNLSDSIEKASGKDAIIKLMNNGKFVPSMCNTISKKILFEDNDINFNHELTNNEDIDCAMRLYVFANKISLLEKPHYYYRQSRIGSATSIYTMHRIQNTLFFIERFINFLKSTNIDPKILPWIYDYLLYQLNIAIGTVTLCPQKQRKELNAKIYEYSDLFGCALTKKNIHINRMRAVLGNNITAYLMGAYIKHSRTRYYFNS